MGLVGRSGLISTGLISTVFLAVWLGLTSIGDGATPKIINPKLVQANTSFGFKLFQSVQKAHPGENVVISPSSVAIALAMTANGANGSTRSAITQALQLNEMSLADLNQANQHLKNTLQENDPQVQLKIANSLWGRQDVVFNPDFLRQTKTAYQAEVTALDFAQPDAVSKINHWVNRSTSGKIPTILDRTNPDDILYLINAVYFNANWSVPFNKAATVTQPFTLSNGQQKSVSLMSRGDQFSYAETDRFQAVSLPYGTGRWRMEVFLPKVGTRLADFNQDLSAINWQTWREQFQSRQGFLQLPKFKLEFATNLKQSLRDLGMGQAFESNADFSKLSDRSAAISQVQHKTFIDVNETGTEAAAVTSVAIATSAILQTTDVPFKMVVDRPFFCVIRDQQTGTILFMGNIHNPGA
jgi:serine protease inhibitor